MRDRQLRLLHTLVEQRSEAGIVLGDSNATPWSHRCASCVRPAQALLLLSEAGGWHGLHLNWRY
jgi:endonuclease/exonuclease/phosphatase (EEP) superfamily protein YafD